MTATDGVRKTFTFEFTIFQLIVKVEYILDLLAKVRNFMCEDASRVKVNCMEMHFHPNARFSAAKHSWMHLHVLQPTTYWHTCWCRCLLFLLCNCLRLKFSLCVWIICISIHWLYTQNGWPWQDLNLLTLRRDSNPQYSDLSSDALSIIIHYHVL